MTSFRSNGPGQDDDSSSRQYATRSSIDTSHFLTSGSTPTYLPHTTKTVDIQTDSHDIEEQQNGLPPIKTTSALRPTTPRFVQSQQLTAQQQQQIAKYIESEMKEKYMEQTRTLEQLQVQMKQDLIDKQAQLMEQLQRLDIKPSLPNGNSSVTNNALDGNGLESEPPEGVNGTLNITNNNDTARAYRSIVSASSPAALTSPSPVNGHTEFHNGTDRSDRRETTANAMTSSFSADESINGNTSQGSSHDTWDSTNAFTHERPVLTGSERSTPTPVLPSVDSSNDLELMSQSIHIPVDLKDADGDNFSGLSKNSSTVPQSDQKPTVVTSKPSGDLIDLTTPLAESAMDDATPRNAVVDPVTADDAMRSTSPPCNGNKSARSTSSIEENYRHSDSSTPPPDSPADDLSASLRFSLRQKHSRHLADMKAYYENELSDLKEKLTNSLALSQHETYQSIELENEKLRGRCKVLEEELLRANRYINNVDKQMDDLESSFNATLAASSRTQAQSDDSTLQHEEQICKSQLSQAESYIQRLETKNKELFTALCDAYEVRDNTARSASQGNLLYDELKEKYEELKASNETTLLKLQSAETSLRESGRDMDSLKKSIKSLEVEQQKLAKENEALRLTTATPLRNSSFSKVHSNGNKAISPMLRAETQLDKSFKSSSPTKHRSRHHQHHTDKPHHHSKQQSPDRATSTHKASHNTDLHTQLSPQPLSDATQSSDNSSREYSKQQHKVSRRSSQRLSGGEPNPQTFIKDDLVSAYSPIVDRQRHSSSASSSGPGIKSTTSPSRQSIDRPYGFHHVGASVSPSKRTQQWAVLSPFNRTTGESVRRDREKNPHRTSSPSSAKKNLSFVLNKSAPNSPQKPKIDKDEVLEKVRTGQVFSESPVLSSPPVIPIKSPSADYRDSRIKLISDAETRLNELLAEKRQLESSLTRMSTTHSRKDIQKQESLEQQLDRVDKDLGSVRMTLRRYNAL